MRSHNSGIAIAAIRIHGQTAFQSAIRNPQSNMPDWKPEIRRQLAKLELAPTREAGITEELAQHLEDRYRDLSLGGATPAEAYRQTLAELSENEVLTQELRRVERRVTSEPIVLGTNRRTNMIADLWQDMRFGARLLVKQPAFTLIAVLSLALGIGANTAIFSLVDAVLLKSLPVKDPGALAQLKWAAGNSFRVSYNGVANRDELPGLRVATSFTYATFKDLQARQQSFTGLFAFAPLEQLNVNVSGQSEIASGQVVTGDYYNTLGLTPQIGRALTTSDDQASAPAAVVLSHHYWRRRFGGDPTVIGKQINLNNAAFTVVGVTPPTFNGTMGNAQAPDLTIALAQEPLVRPGASALRDQLSWWLMIMGRMKPGVTREQAQAELAVGFQQRALAERRAPQSPNQSAQLAAGDMPRLMVAPGRQGDTHWGRAYYKSLYLLMAVGGLVLLLACANVANLLLARALGRQKEIAVRLALGAGRGRLLRQLVTESLLLALAGGAVGIVIALWGRDLLLSLQFPGQDMAALQTGVSALDWRLLGLTIAVSVATGLLFGLAPAWQTTRVDLTPALKETGRGSHGQARSRLSQTLVVAQVALSLLLLVGAGLFIRTLRNLQQINPGFEAQNLLLFRVDPRLSGYQGEQITSLYQRLFARLEAVPGAQAATFSRHPLLSGSRGIRPLFVAGQDTSLTDPTSGYVHIVRANFLETMRVPILLGRDLREQDDAQGPKAAVINQALARRLFPNQNPVGQRIGFTAETASQFEIVGVSQDAKYDNLRESPPPTIYIPWLQEGRIGQMNIEVRTTTDPALLLTAIRQAAHEVDGNLPLFDVKTQIEQSAQSMAQERLFAALLSFFGLLALLLAAVGLYGVLAASVAQRTQEIGIRIALGAHPRDVLRLVIGQGMRLVVPGVVIGLAGAYAATRWIASFLYDVNAVDWPTYGLIAALLLAVALLACWIPARRATKIDPLLALRCE
jgi:predicted permease